MPDRSGRSMLRLLGETTLQDRVGHEIKLPRKIKAILAALALAGPAGMSRERLSDMFWQDRDTQGARKSLRQAILDLRKGLGELRDVIQADAESVWFDANEMTVDVAAFEALAAEPSGDVIDQVLDLYRGDLLAGLQIKESEFEAWLLPMRQRLRFLAIGLFGEYLADATHGMRVAVVAERLLKLDPLSETAHQALMRMYIAQGEHSAALKQFAACRDLLHRELGVAPSAETIAVLDQAQRMRRLPREAAAMEADPMQKRAAPDPPEVPDAELEALARSSTTPSIAVMPFDNLSRSEEDAYFADGITEEITTALSYVQWLFVIASQSAFTFQGRDIDAANVGKELGVRYLLFGNVRRAGGRVRINARLVDAASSSQVWAGRFEDDVEDIFDLQDRLAAEVVGAIQPGLRAAEIALARRKSPDDLNAYDLYLRSLPHAYRMSEADTTQALAMLKQAVEIDPSFNRARSLSCWIYTLRQSQGWSVRGQGEAETARELAAACLAAEMENDAEILWQAGYTLGYFDGNYEDSLAFIDRSLALNANSAQAWIIRGMVNGFIGRAEEAIKDCQNAIRLSPLDPLIYRAYYGLALANIVKGDYKNAIKWARQGVASGPNYIAGYYMLIAGLANAGNDEECARVGDRVLQQLPEMTVTRWSENTPIRYRPAKKVIAAGLLKAGLPK